MREKVREEDQAGQMATTRFNQIDDLRINIQKLEEENRQLKLELLGLYRRLDERGL